MLVLTYIAFGCYFCVHKQHSSNGGQYFAPTCPLPVNNLIYLKEQNTDTTKYKLKLRPVQNLLLSQAGYLAKDYAPWSSASLMHHLHLF